MIIAKITTIGGLAQGNDNSNIYRLVYLYENKIFISKEGYNKKIFNHENILFDAYYDIVDISKREIVYIHHYMPQDTYVFPVTIKKSKVCSMDMYDFEEKIFDVLDKIMFEKLC